ncbi:ROK family protein [Xanthomonas vasicola]|uniref:ROK family protein n=1 Tax=Xanthomonas vasicola TaxID=56459 RepID=UPI00031CD0C7|nr:ROK family protein [Xanthomonas vasicola]AZR32167.1 ROK family protein [Xanthomonas vasicola pv. musacearum NCPPB 4379]KFA06994.1 transcriptional regulator [Xanthomonas vasicola pv. musacearum NCPPB 2005]KFA13853.1 transcriptional regulator [Xanthomonas vasicola pv. musacearum NCPPB 4380]KFA18318.1 transcriptional regulator [Xanthomonas vasicola pv. musacearum NCPPB 4394]KFA19488.1 transcriptional regulator [Xanthomonas vasicola pv. musacearum NCPPB 4392]
MPSSVAVALPPHSPAFPSLSLNERDMLDRLRLAGVLTRADFSRGSGLTVQTAVRLIEGLQARGMVQMGEAVARSGRGKPGMAVSLNPAYGHTLGISIATDVLTLALVDFSGAVLAVSEVALTDTTLYGVLTQLQAADAALLARVDDAGPRLGIGVAMTGFFTGEDAFINPPEPLRALGQIALCPWLAEAFGQPVWMDNDGSVAAAGEAMLGVGQRHRDFAYLYLSYGLGGGLVIDGQVMRGARGNAGEFAGMLPAQKLERATLELLRELLAEDGVIFADVRRLLAAYDPAWPAIERWIVRSAPGLSLIISAITAVCDPEAIVFGGRLPCDLARRLIAAVQIDNLPRRGQSRPMPVLLPAEAPADACAIGAATLPLQARYFR